MAYISSSSNRFYVAPESAYGQVGELTSFSRIPAVKLAVRQQRQRADRKDKTGSRTFSGYPVGVKRATTYDLTTYMRSWDDQMREPSYGPLFQACMGRPAAMSGAMIVSASDASHVTLGAPHGLIPGQAVAFGAEIRFVAAVADDRTVALNAPFTVTPATGVTLGTTATYNLATELSSATILDCWSPTTAVQRIVNGAAVDQLRLQINGDFHSFEFSGPACDIIDSESFEQGQGALTAFPAEPVTSAAEYSIVPGHLGQAWLGNAPDQFFTLTAATLSVNNNLDLRDDEFGWSTPRGISPGIRAVTFDFSVYQQDDSQTKALYQAARQDSPLTIMLQLGQKAGQLMGIYLKGVTLSTPEFDDSKVRQQWIFKNCRAQGIADDEISIAFA